MIVVNWKQAIWAALGATGGILLLRAVSPRTNLLIGAGAGAALAAGLTAPTSSTPQQLSS